MTKIKYRHYRSSNFILHFMPKLRRWSQFCLLLLLSLIGCLFASPGLASHTDFTHDLSGLLLAQTPASNPLQQAEQLYQSGQFSAAAAVLQQVIETARLQNNLPQQVIALRNLALVYQQLGQWTEANQAIDSALQVLD